MINDIFSLLIEKRTFFLSLLTEHLFISLVSILIALAAGLVLGVFISEYQKSSKYVLGVCQLYLYDSFHIAAGLFNSVFRNWKYDGNYRPDNLRFAAHGQEYSYRNDQH